MDRLRYFYITNVIIVILFCRVIKATDQDAFIAKMHGKNGCECIKYNCGCCQHLGKQESWKAISINGNLCVYAAYKENQYGVSLTMMYNDFTIFNETITTVDPPPICFTIDVLDTEVCLRIYNMNIIDNKFYACFQAFSEIMYLSIAKTNLGCIQTKET